MLSLGKEMTIFAGKVDKHIWMSQVWVSGKSGTQKQCMCDIND